MLSLIVSPKSDQPLADQIVAGIKRQIDDRHLRPGSKLPSIRNFADTYNVSRFTVVEAYDRLVAMGYLQSRRGAGFYTAAAPAHAESAHPAPSDNHKRNEELVWLIRRLLEADENTLLAGGPWLPNSWLDEAGIRQSLNVLARKNGAYLLEYGHPFGYLPLREHLALMLAALGITAHPGQILLTQGTSQALELVIRYLLKPGDAALVDDPGYYNMFGNLRLQGVEMLAVPRNPDGPDVAILEKLAAAHRPKVYFTQSVMQNPTGTDMSPHVAFKVLQAAERHNFTVVEDDIFCDLQVEDDAAARDARPAQPRDLCAQLFQDAVGQPARRFHRLRAGHRQRARRHQDADQHHHIAIHRAARLSDAGGRPLPQIPVAPARAAGRGAPQCRARLRAHRAGAVRGARGRHVRLGAIPAYRGFAHAGGGLAARRHHARAGRGLSSASRALAMDAVQRRGLRGYARAALAAAAGGGRGGDCRVTLPVATAAVAISLEFISGHFHL